MRHFLALMLLGALLAVPASLRAQNYSINWYTIAGGGGTSSNGNYSVSGTIGQPATATLSGENYSLTGGFWSIISVIQSPGSPLLTITRFGNQAIISWPVQTVNFVLQFTSNLAASNSWAPSGATVTTSSGTNSVTVPANSGYQYYRLEAP